MVTKSTAVLLAIAVVAVAAVSIVGVAYAYTASTENSSNTSSAEFVTLSQDNYTWGETNVKYNTTTKKVGNNIDFIYTLMNADGTAKAGAITNVTNTYGVKIGNDDLLKATATTGLNGPFKLAVELDANFNTGWSFIILFDKGANGDDRYQWVEFNYSNSAWAPTYHGYNGQVVNTGIWLVKDTSYTTSLYVGKTGGDDVLIAGDQTDTVQIVHEVAVASGIEVDNNAPASVINAGTVKFTYTSA
jgi:hypothetical protein